MQGPAGGGGGNESDDDAGVGDTDGASAFRAQLNVHRPKDGDLKYWTTGVEVGQGQASERIGSYGWDRVEGEPPPPFLHKLHDHDERRGSGRLTDHQMR